MKDDSGMSRRDFVGVTAAALVGAVAPHAARAGASRPSSAQGPWELYVGTYTASGASRGIYRLGMDRGSGAFRAPMLAAETPEPSFLAFTPDRRTLVAVNELVSYDGAASGAVTTFAREAASGALTRIGERASLGGAPCYVAVDRTGRHVLVANYVGGNLAVFPLDAGGAPGAHAALVQHNGRGADPVRQAGPHAHCIVLDAANRFAYAADLGIDRVRIYRFDGATGALRPAAPPEVALAPGAGPRHLAFAPDGRTLFVANELDSTLVALTVDRATGALRPGAVVSTRPATATGANYPADLHVHPAGHTVYVSNRGDDSIAVFAARPGRTPLELRQTVATGGHWPRNFALDPSGRWLIVAHQRSHSLTSFAVDAATGLLTRTGAEVQVPSPVCVLFSGATIDEARAP